MRWFCSLCCCCLLLVGCIGVEDATVSEPDVRALRVGLVTDPATFDPHLTNSDSVGIVLRQVYDTLIYRHPDTLGFVPGLATDWSVSEDGLVYTFRLRQGVTFHDQTPFNAQAVAANLDRIVTFGEEGRARQLLGPYESYTIIDDVTIAIQLSEPYAGFLDALSQPFLGIASPTALQAYSAPRYQFHQVGTGPFEFLDLIPGLHVHLSRYAAYRWGPEFHADNVVNPVELVHFLFVTQPAARARALLDGEMDIVGQILPNDARDLAVNPQLQIYPLVLPGQPYQFLMNTSQYPTDSLQVRQALLFGTNRDEIVNSVLQGFSGPAWSPLSRSTLFHSSSFDGIYSYDLLEARSVLEFAGFADTDDDGIWEFDRVPLNIRVVAQRDDLAPVIIERLRTQWREAGLQVSLVVAPTRSSLLEIVESGDYNLVFNRAERVEPDFLADYYAGGGLDNWTNYEGEQLTQQLRDARQEMDIQARAGLYVAAQSTILQEGLVVPVADAINLVGANRTVGTLQFHADRRAPILFNVSFLPMN